MSLIPIAVTVRQDQPSVQGSLQPEAEVQPPLTVAILSDRYAFFRSSHILIAAHEAAVRTKGKPEAIVVKGVVSWKYVGVEVWQFARRDAYVTWSLEMKGEWSTGISGSIIPS